MKGLFAFGAVAAGVANASFAPRNFLNTTSSVELTTSTLYTTSVHTVTACPSTVTNCPVGPHVTTETIVIGTTVCPVSSQTSVVPTSTASPTSYTTSTLYTTSVHTVTACPPTVTNCPVGPHVTTETIVIGTTVCPVASNTTVVVVPVPTPTQYTTSTVYTTKVHTVTACPPTVTDCPVGPHVTTETIAVSTTVCPVTLPPPGTGVPPPPPSGNSTTTLYTTKTWVTAGQTTTEVIPTGTTQVPVWVSSVKPSVIVPPAYTTTLPASQPGASQPGASQPGAPTKPGQSQPSSVAPQPTQVTAGAATNGLQIAVAAVGALAFFL